jgi:hypothetical protein
LFSRGAHVHQFAGIVACAGCHELLMRNGKNGYRCRNDGRGCSSGLTVTEKLALRAIEAVVPEAIKRCPEIEKVIETASAEYDIASAENRLSELEDRQRCLATNWAHQPATVPEWVLDEERALAYENARLQAQLEHARLAVRVARELITRAPQLMADPIATLRQLGPAHEEFCVRALFSVVELEGTGHGNGRIVRVVTCELNGWLPGCDRGGLD